MHFNYIMNRKGISPIIASVLLLAVTLSIMGIFSGWAPQLVQSVTEDTSNRTDHRLNCNDADLGFETASFSGSNLDVAIRNTGNYDLNNVIIAAYYTNDTLAAQDTGNAINGGQLNSISMSVNSKPGYLEAYSEQCGSVTTQTQDITG